MNDDSQTVSYNREYEQRTNNIYFSILCGLEILGRPNWESTQLTSFGKGPLNGPCKVWLIPCSCGYLHSLFLLDSNKCFFICLVPCMYICLYYFLILCSYFYLLFLTVLFLRHILQFTMFDSISSQPGRNITEIKKHFMAHDERKSVALVITKTNTLI